MRIYQNHTSLMILAEKQQIVHSDLNLAVITNSFIIRIITIVIATVFIVLLQCYIIITPLKLQQS